MTDDDKQLLLWAARAAGLEVLCAIGEADNNEYFGIIRNNVWEEWSPLTDDGDALRLAVKLNIGVISYGPDHWDTPNTSVAIFAERRLTQLHAEDANVATRRAITRAAAEIGKAMGE